MRSNFRRTKVLINSVVYFCILIGLVFSFSYGIKYFNDVNDNSKMAIYRVDTNEKKIAITFDVAWGTDNIDKIMDILEKHNVKATFFLVGSWIDDNKEYTKKISAKGHELGSHSNTHANIKEISKKDIENELEITRTKIKEVTGVDTMLFRPPYGDTDSKSLKVCEELGYKVVKWDLDSTDWKEIGANHVIEKVVKDVRPGSIILFHADAEGVENYLDTILTTLERDGYKIDNVSNVIYKDNYTVDSNGEQKRK